MAHATTSLWPRMSYMCRIRSAADLRTGGIHACMFIYIYIYRERERDDLIKVGSLIRTGVWGCSMGRFAKATVCPSPPVGSRPEAARGQKAAWPVFICKGPWLIYNQARDLKQLIDRKLHGLSIYRPVAHMFSHIYKYMYTHIYLRDLCGAVTSKLPPIFRGNETFVTHRLGTGFSGFQGFRILGFQGLRVLGF